MLRNARSGNAMPIKVGLSLKPKDGGTSANRPTPGKRKPLFAAGNDSDQDETVPTKPTSQAQEIAIFDEEKEVVAPSQSVPKTVPKAGPLNRPQPKRSAGPSSCASSATSGPTLSSNLAHKAIASTAESLDPSIYDYDAHYATTSSHAAEAARRAAARDQAVSGTPQYMDSMLAAAKTRERDQLRAKDKMLQKEREAEGEELKDSEQFVTEAYREQQEATRRAEDEERKKEEAEMKNREGKGMRGFWQGMMNEEEERHKKLAAGLAGREGGEDAIEYGMGAEEKEQAATKLAHELNAKGANVVINEDGIVADKRQLLTGGLNVTPTPRAAAASSAAAAKAKATSQQKWAPEMSQHQRRDAREAQRDRQTRMMEAQLEASQKRAAEEEAEALQKREMASKSQKTGAEISSAKERFLQRKREAEAAKARGET